MDRAAEEPLCPPSDPHRVFRHGRRGADLCALGRALSHDLFREPPRRRIYRDIGARREPNRPPGAEPNRSPSRPSRGAGRGCPSRRRIGVAARPRRSAPPPFPHPPAPPPPPPFPPPLAPHLSRPP